LNSLNLYTRLIIVFLTLILVLIVWQGYSGFQQFKQFHQHLSERSVTSTSREIVFLIQSIKSRTRLFSEQENEILLTLLKSPKDKAKKDQLAKKIKRYFPKYLTFTIANQEGIVQIKQSDLLIGKTCRIELLQYARNGFQDNPINMHTGPFKDADHFDVLAPIIFQGEQVGILFISFKLSDLSRVLSHGAVFGHELLLVNDRNPNKIVLTSSPERVNHYRQQSVYSSAIPDTHWKLEDIPQPSLFSDEYKRLLVQGFLIVAGFLGVATILLRAIKKEEQKSGSAQSLLAGVEDERRRIAMDMHDQVLSELSHISRETVLLKVRDVAEAEPINNQSLEAINTSLVQITKNIRSIINDLHPHFLDIVGLEESIRDCLQSHLNTPHSPSWSLKMDDDLESRIDKTQRFNLYRIILEVVNNIQKHADCKAFSIVLTFSNDTLNVLIEDNGIGFDMATAKKKRGLGLRNIEMHSQQLNAQIQWSKSSQRDNQGTCFMLSVNL